MAGNSGGYVKGTWSWVWGGGRRGRESRGVEEMTGLWEESDGTGAATSDQREKAPGGLAGWAALRAGRWRVERDGRWQGRVGFCGGRRLAVDRPPQACWTLPGHLNPHQNSFPAQPVSNDHRTKRAGELESSGPALQARVQGDRGSSRSCVESRVSLGGRCAAVRSIWTAQVECAPGCARWSVGIGSRCRRWAGFVDDAEASNHTGTGS